MAGAELDLGDEELGRLLGEAARRLTDTRPLMLQIGEYLIRSTKDRFQRQTAPDGTPWAPKTAVTIAAQIASWGRSDPRPLHGPSRNLSRQIFYQVDGSGRAVEWGSPMIYAAVQQWGAAQGAFGTTARGGPIPWGDIPARPFIGTSPDDLSALTAIVSDWLSNIGD